MPVSVVKPTPAMCCVLPMPDDAYWNSFGFAFISATSSLTSFAGTLSLTTSTFGTVTMRPIGVSPLSGS